MSGWAGLGSPVSWLACKHVLRLRSMRLGVSAFSTGAKRYLAGQQPRDSTHLGRQLIHGRNHVKLDLCVLKEGRDQADVGQIQGHCGQGIGVLDLRGREHTQAGVAGR